MTTAPRVSVVIPAYNEGNDIIAGLDRIFESVTLDAEVLVVVDSEEDTTVPVVKKYAKSEPRLKYLVNNYGRGPAQAIRYGIDHANADTVVVTMSDGCDVRGRSMISFAWSSAALSSPRHRATWPVANRSADLASSAFSRAPLEIRFRS